MSVTLAPVPGFCIKSSSLTQCAYPLRPLSNHIALSPPPATLPIPKSRKVFVNIAFDPNVPAPPPGSHAAIDRAMAALAGPAPPDADADDYFVPLIVSDPRQDVDKGKSSSTGKSAVVFDAIFNSSLKSKALKSLEFKAFLIELALQRIEFQSAPPNSPPTAQPPLLLSRQFGTPNIASKGKLQPRTVHIPKALYSDQGDSVSGKDNQEAPKKALVQELSSDGKDEHPAWSWELEQGSGRVKVVVRVPRMTREIIPTATLDVEPHRIELRVPGMYSLDVDFASEDLGGKLDRELDVDGATAEWRVSEGLLAIYA
ncbi:hypothetical protein GLOTRDRAFT_60596 [Gloeophyllum trabeum ATCC 11539]|uniref:PIH1 N-terminal domain-containing protein n=1 Tax=Gloeophyllum trabeum (strain ATCC 11539 / FP-39264 / Madison 617) TaxID=670483 RepID=S7Q8F3_GLOTA|nr:uncharacterized protein GLOTRDRAFT_60596 [Gloeophyllum trabeum ATCC 11539]EPQ55812.1 hypothetical protein GLOTRDRAFT_60596 [Gloeophyllum trabeum ATCC 11539]